LPIISLKGQGYGCAAIGGRRPHNMSALYRRHQKLFTRQLSCTSRSNLYTISSDASLSD